MVWGALVGAVQQVPAATAAGLTDSFNRADSAVTLGNADTGQAWTAHAGTWGIASNRAYCPIEDGGYVASIDAGLADATWQIVVNGTYIGSPSSHPRFLFHLLDASTYLYVELLENLIRLYRVDGAQLAQAAQTTTNGQDYRITVVTSGNSVTIKVDGVTKITYTLTGADTAYAAYTRVGLNPGPSGSPAVKSRWDDLSVQP